MAFKLAPVLKLKSLGDTLKVLLYFLLLFSLFFSQACSDVNIRPAGDDFLSIQAKGQICTEEPASVSLFAKILFVVDTSGSNVSGNGGAGTDPGKALRYGSMLEFVQRMSASESGRYISWGLITFNNGNAISYVGDENRYFSNDISEMEIALENFRNAGDSGSTPYVAALEKTHIAISTDLANEEDLIPNYNVIFISDGFPMPVDQNPDSTIYALSEQISNLVQGNVHLSTVYYGPEDAGAIARLQEMARLGSGEFQQVTADSPNINIDSLIQGREAREPYLIKRFMVYNLTSTTCDDGSIGVHTSDHWRG